MNRKNICLILCPIVLIIVARLLPHLPNFVPVTAVALMAGVYLGKRWALILPLTGLLISDFFVGFYEWRLMLSVYGSFAIIGLFSWWLRKHKNVPNVLTASLSASLFFFFITNFAVWAFSAWYTKDLAGLLYCFQLAIPFFRYTLAGDLFYVVVLFGSLELVKMFVKEMGWKKTLAYCKI